MVDSDRRSLSKSLLIDDLEDEILIKDIYKPFMFNTSDRTDSLKRNLFILLGHWFGIPARKMELIHEVVFLTYNSSLIYDDIQDNTALRRSIPTAHTVYGIPRTILGIVLSHKYLLDIIEELDNVEVWQTILTEGLELFMGQGLEVYRRHKNICPTESEYLQTAYLQAGACCSIIGKIIAIFSTSKKRDVEKLLRTFGIYTQIHNDYANLYMADCFNSKGFCEDLTDGKFSFPLVHAINNFPEEGKEIQGILHKRTTDINEKKRCVSLLEKCGSFEYTKKKLQELEDFFILQVAQFDDNPQLKVFLETAILSYFHI